MVSDTKLGVGYEMSNLKWYPIPKGVVGRSFPKLAVGNLYVVSYIDDPDSGHVIQASQLQSCIMVT
jgi:hypothetical protein